MEMICGLLVMVVEQLTHHGSRLPPQSQWCLFAVFLWHHSHSGSVIYGVHGPPGGQMTLCLKIDTHTLKAAGMLLYIHS